MQDNYAIAVAKLSEKARTGSPDFPSALSKYLADVRKAIELEGVKMADLRQDMYEAELAIDASLAERYRLQLLEQQVTSLQGVWKAATAAKAKSPA